ncbi:hypothetical protein BMS3Bbin04_00472 [bacterium BMS3Bbin04]|nr:hypothetical protein BMS3Bbin04_00472 [bacterium BMS3Bbin04]
MLQTHLFDGHIVNQVMSHGTCYSWGAEINTRTDTVHTSILGHIPVIGESGF